jgi:adenylate kinase family enzyme
VEDAERLGWLRRIAVVGTSGSGKTTLAQRLAWRLGIPHVELDALHWGPNWTPVPPDEFRELVSQVLDGDDWTTDGNYGSIRDIVWSRADTVVWLDYALPVVLWRVTTRTIRRIASQEELWNENREQFGPSFLSRDSIILWALHTYHRRRREYPVLFGKAEHKHLNVVHLCSPRAARQWLEGLATTGDQRRATD